MAQRAFSPLPGDFAADSTAVRGGGAAPAALPRRLRRHRLASKVLQPRPLGGSSHYRLGTRSIRAFHRPRNLHDPKTHHTKG